MMTKQEESLKQSSTRRMSEYRYQLEARPQPRSTKSDTGGEAEKLERVLRYHNADKMKIGEMTFMVPSDAGYAEWNPRSGREWTEKELPIGYRMLKSISGVQLDIKKSRDKLNLATRFPEFVMQMLIHASNDYKKYLTMHVTVVREALTSYAKYLISSNELEGENFSKAEIEMLLTDVGLASLADSANFKLFFDKWKAGGFTSETGAIYKPSPTVQMAFNKQVIEPSRLSSVFGMISTLGTFDVFDAAHSKANLARELGLNSKAEFEITKVDAYFILEDQQFRYFVDGSGGGKGSRVYYWDWVRNNAEAISDYRSQF